VLILSIDIFTKFKEIKPLGFELSNYNAHKNKAPKNSRGEIYLNI